MQKGQHHCILRCFCFPNAAKHRQEMAQKRSQIDFQKHLIILASFFPAPDPQKRHVLAVVVGACLLAVWRFCPPGHVRFSPWVVVCWCSSFGALGLLPALGCFSSLWWLWLVLSFGALELQPALLCFSSLLLAVIGISFGAPCWFRLTRGPPGLSLWLKIRLTCAGGSSLLIALMIRI